MITDKTKYDIVSKIENLRDFILFALPLKEYIMMNFQNDFTNERFLLLDLFRDWLWQFFPNSSTFKVIVTKYY